ncbi:MAG: RNA ligase family protein [Acidobacteria bacterium]|nr:RNA ligase family protein [Acidobacteriota bacterium]
MIPILKYPRTPHINGSRLQSGDEDLLLVEKEALSGLPLVVEEKLDGSNCGISFSPEGGLILQSRGHVLMGGPRERQFDLFKRWASHHTHWLRETLGPRYVMYGEWLFARHTIPYDHLPHYFLEFDILDRESGEFLSTELRRALLAGGPVVCAPVLAAGRNVDLESQLGLSTCATNEMMEGLYVKHEAGGTVRARFKYVRGSFLQAVTDAGEHWMDRPIEPNRLRPGVDLFVEKP